MGAAQQEHPVQRVTTTDAFQANNGVYGMYGASAAAGWTCH